jgi:hypothetical protein
MMGKVFSKLMNISLQELMCKENITITKDFHTNEPLVGLWNSGIVIREPGERHGTGYTKFQHDSRIVKVRKHNLHLSVVKWAVIREHAHYGVKIFLCRYLAYKFYEQLLNIGMTC